MSDCCAKKSCDLEVLARRQSRVLWLVLAINGVMFAIELGAGILAGSLALTGDSLDMLGDAVAYGSSLYVIRMGALAKARSAMLKGGLMLATAIVVLVRALYQASVLSLPDASTMGVVGTMALVANLICLIALTRHRGDDVNMSSVWLCSRNDIIANGAVLLAAGLVAWTRTPWADLVVGLGITLLFTRSALKVFADARSHMHSSVIADR